MRYLKSNNLENLSQIKGKIHFTVLHNIENRQ